MAKRKTAAQWREFLRALGRTGNARVAAREAGMDVATAYDRRIKDDRFAALWDAALARGKARAAAGKARLKKAVGTELVVRKTRNGTHLMRVAPGRWCAKTETTFLAELRRTGCVRRAAAACGLSTNALYYRRKTYAGFAALWAAAEASATERIPALLAAATIASLDPEIEGEDLPKVNVDQAIAISRLKGGGGDAERRRGGGRGGIRLTKPPLSEEELRADLASKLKVLGKRLRMKKVAQGWTETREGHMIPPGWVYAGPDEVDGEAPG